ncbi:MULTISPECIES: nuclear transport factor 2 family protein [Furfurilactobacillus]|uniref:SnoaL-like domain-containing protein n=1 Tax=Furfurilactobacillus rossiae TaxID=231049 RepID=A0A7C9MRB6_9LACO|nr:nuclear transport factor 2 family protein [Furfurilactobacillus milii]MYV05924.1 hypothetical protein [Furfurilactobacillus milii]
MFNIDEVRLQKQTKQEAVKHTIETYFQALDGGMDAAMLTSLFCSESFLRFKSHERAGHAAILEMIQTLLTNPQHLTNMTIDVPSLELVALVHGHVVIQGTDNYSEPYSFTMTLVSDRLIRNQDHNRWLIHRLNYQPV